MSSIPVALLDYEQFVDPRLLEALASQSLLTVFRSARGSCLADDEGNTFLDVTCGYGAAHLGHNHPRIACAVSNAARGVSPLLHPFATLAEAGSLARMLCELAGRGLEKAFFCNTGSEAVNVALELAMSITGRTKYVTLRGSYHGRLVSAGGPSQRICEDAHHVLAEVRSGTYAAVVLELVQGSNGARCLAEEEVASIVCECKRTGALVILDEVLTGLGRTGRWFAFQHHAESLQPDFVICSKGLTGGCVPMAAVLMTNAAYESASKDSGLLPYRSTMAGYALGIAVANAAIKIINDETLLENAQARAGEIMSGLNQLAREGVGISDISGRGLLIEFRPHNFRDEAWAGFRCMLGLYERRILCSFALENPEYVTLAPALNITPAETQTFLDTLRVLLLEADGV